MNKREFYIDTDTENKVYDGVYCYNAYSLPSPSKGKNDIRVIEYSEYEKAIKILKQIHEWPIGDNPASEVLVELKEITRFVAES